jgi:hypothetical protein
MTPILAHLGPPAAGAPLEDVIPATIVALIGAALLAWLTVAYRRGGARPLRVAVDGTGRALGLPGWSALPTILVRLSLIVAVFGFYWDVSTHIDNGRDPGPFANPAHFFILAGLVGIFVAGYLSMMIGTEPSKTSIRLSDNWHVPLGGVLIVVCGAVALLGFPLDDVWHRLFGQDVTLWGPTHVQMVGGASLSAFASWVLLREAQLARSNSPSKSKKRGLPIGNEALAAGAFLVAMSTLQGEFDFGVPQFRLVFHPILLMIAAGVALVAARIRLGRGGAIGAAVFFIALRGLLSLIVGPILGRTLLHFPLYIVEALLVEFVAARVGRDRQLTLGLWCGLAIGTVGLAAEWLWSHIWMPLPWPADLLPEAAIYGFVAAMAASIIGAYIGRGLAGPEVPRQPIPKWVGLAALTVAVACVVVPLNMGSPPPITASVTLDEAQTNADGEWAHATVELDPADAADGALWFNAFAWQGLDWNRGSSITVALEETEAGTYQTTEPLPVHGEWKTMLRLHRDDWLGAMPIYMPYDPAIPAEEIPAEGSFARDFIADHELLQREARGGSGILIVAAYGVLVLIVIAWAASLWWGVARFRKAVQSEQVSASPAAA